MLTMHEIKAHYNLTEANEERLQALLPLAEAHRQVIADKFYDYLLGMAETAELIRNEEVLERLRTTHQQWFLNLFNGRYDNQYLMTLQRIGSAHVKAGVNAHFVNAAMNLVRQCFLNVIESSFPDRDERRAHREALNKILDINLDVMTASYREEELKKVFLHRRLESKLIGAAERFTYGLNLILVLALAGVSVAVIGLFFWDIAQIFHSNIEKGILGALGTLLIIWMMIELMDNEIKNLKGGKFNILVFIGVIMVALIREILISTLRHDQLETQVFLAGTLLILGVVYFLVAKSQSFAPHQ